MRKKFIVGGVLLLVVVIIISITNWASGKSDKKVIDASKLYLGEMLIEYPEDLDIADAKVEKIAATDDFNKYELTGYVEKNGLGISEIDVELHENLTDYAPWKWQMKCSKCPDRKKPPDDVNSDLYKKWQQIERRVRDEG